MDDLISRQELLESIERISVKGNVLDDDWIYRFIQEFPSAERKTGRWIKVGDNTWRCSECGEISCCNANYCPDCGAEMIGEDNG